MKTKTIQTEGSKFFLSFFLLVVFNYFVTQNMDVDSFHDASEHVDSDEIASILPDVSTGL